MLTFNVTYSIVTPESAECGDYDESGFIGEGLSFRDAMAAIRETRTGHVDGVLSIECDSWPVISPRWVTVSNGPEFSTGACEERSLHFPDAMTPASRRRVCRLLGVRNVGPVSFGETGA